MIIENQIGIVGKLAQRYISIIPESMNKSPCAKLISFKIPYTIVYPIATRAYCPPVAKPLIRYGTIFIEKIPFKLKKYGGNKAHRT